MSRAAEKAAKDVSTFLNATAKEEEERGREREGFPLFLVYTKGACGRFRAPVSEEWWPGLSVNIWQVPYFCELFLL